MSSSPQSGGEDHVVRTGFARGPGDPRTQSRSRYTMQDLVDQTGFSLRTIRFYISEGLIRAANGRGPSATYDRDHLLRLMRIAEIKDEVRSIPAIKERIDGLSTEDLEAHFARQSGPEIEAWKRLRLHRNLELHVRYAEGDVDFRFEQAMDQIMQHARLVLDAYDLERQTRG
jgi:DNA-binding transcriptional MerR regulator